MKLAGHYNIGKQFQKALKISLNSVAINALLKPMRNHMLYETMQCYLSLDRGEYFRLNPSQGHTPAQTPKKADARFMDLKDERPS